MMSIDRPTEPCSETTATQGLSPQEETLLAILDGADPFTEGGAPGADRADLETLGLLARTISPATVGVHSREALFRRLHLSSGVTNVGLEAVLPFRGAELERSLHRFSWAPLALAAAVLMAVGLGTWSGFLFSELRQSRSLVAGLESELDRYKLEGTGVGDYQQVLFENQRLRRQIGVATRPRTRVCALSATAPDQPDAKGTVFLRPEEGQWVIATHNLAKCELGRRYRLWFLGKNGDVMGGELLDHVTGAQQVEMASGELPEGTAALLVTLEFPDKFGTEPGGERVLYGDRSVEIY